MTINVSPIRVGGRKLAYIIYVFVNQFSLLIYVNRIANDWWCQIGVIKRMVSEEDGVLICKNRRVLEPAPAPVDPETGGQWESFLY